MKHILPHITAWVLLLCLVATNLAPLFSPLESRGHISVVIDVHNDSLPSDGKEERTEWLKTFARHIIPNPCFNLEMLAQRYFEHPHRSKRQIFLPVILPPPKVLA
ncbi:MAG: hypothetical protein IPM82_06880 [Saprospiraceae bacterium]|nr:hypothetical protein [Saprospiraceae bacterium]